MKTHMGVFGNKQNNKWTKSVSNMKKRFPSTMSYFIHRHGGLIECNSSPQAAPLTAAPRRRHSRQ